MTRRDALKFVALFGVFGSVYVLLSRAKVRVRFLLRGGNVNGNACMLMRVLRLFRRDGGRACSQDVPVVRSFLLQFHVGYVIQIGIIIYVWRSFGYFKRVTASLVSLLDAPIVPGPIWKPSQGYKLRAGHVLCVAEGCFPPAVPRTEPSNHRPGGDRKSCSLQAIHR